MLYRLFTTTLIGLLFMGAMAGCSRSAEHLDRREERDPLLRKARVLKNAGDFDAAIEMYEKALARKPDLARAHLEVGLIYDQHREDYIRAIYHYRRYIELRPDADKRSYIKELIDYAELAFAASLPEKPSGAAETVAMLKKEVSALRSQLHQSQLASAAAQGQAAQASARPGAAAPRPAPAQPAVQTYRVQPGDSLSRIASKIYGDSSKWEAIFEANRHVLGNPKNLKVGQDLILPKL